MPADTIKKEASENAPFLFVNDVPKNTITKEKRVCEEVIEQTKKEMIHGMKTLFKKIIPLVQYIRHMFSHVSLTLPKQKKANIFFCNKRSFSSWSISNNCHTYIFKNWYIFIYLST